MPLECFDDCVLKDIMNIQQQSDIPGDTKPTRLPNPAAKSIRGGMDVCGWIKVPSHQVMVYLPSEDEGKKNKQ